jgi:carbon-monoxide dehydrogenase medium subunit
MIERSITTASLHRMAGRGKGGNVKAAEVAYARPATLEEAIGLLARHGEDARPLAGGQSLITSLNMRLSAPALLVDLNRIPGLSGVAETGEAIRIGAMTRHREVGEAELVRTHLPLLAAAVPHISHPAIRNRGTIGGSLALADPATEFPACCLALGATMIAVGPSGERRIAAGDFFHGLYATALGADDLLIAVEIPKQDPGAVWFFDELARRHGDYALAGIAATARRQGAGLTDARIVLFGVGDRPVLAVQAAEALGHGDVKAAQDALGREIAPADDVAVRGATRRHLARVLVGRAASAMMGAA